MHGERKKRRAKVCVNNGQLCLQIPPLVVWWHKHKTVFFTSRTEVWLVPINHYITADPQSINLILPQSSISMRDWLQFPFSGWCIIKCIFPRSGHILPISPFGTIFVKLAQAALCAPPKVALQCVAGHCYYHRSVSLLPRWLARAMRSLAIVITIVRSSLFLFFSPSFAFDPLRGNSRV